MSFIIIPPCDELKDFVNHFWARSWSDSTYYATATTNIELTFGIKSTSDCHSEFIFSSIKGQSDNFGQFPASGSFELFGVSLYPYALPFLFNISVSELENKLFDLDLLLKYEGEMLNEKMTSSDTVEKRISIISEYLKKRLRKGRWEDRKVIHATKQIKAHCGNVNISSLSTEYDLSQKQFERRFKEYAGFTPRLYSKIVRFETVLLSAKNKNNLTETAYQHGYFDQSHFIRDFKRFSGFSPRTYFSLV